ncbi:class B sortase [Evansella sp. AB-rgal1]|uniref:class B sortase n=1 Tax=Evansella sp. AB-rgal1 TaxID=3242696 RepID=UPI00359D5396
MSLSRLVSLVSLLVLLFSGYKMVEYYVESYTTEQTYEELHKSFQISSMQSRLEERIVNERLLGSVHKNDELTDQQDEPQIIMEQFQSLLVENEETVGWISVPNTRIQYPVVKTSDNEYYLEHDFHGNQASAGSIFMDYRNEGDASDRHTIIYGHHMKDGTMFKELEKYKEKDFFHNNSIITLQTLYEEVEWEIFSAYVTSTDFYYIVTHFRSNRDFVDFAAELKKKSIFPTNIEIGETDQILTLSTCSYEFDDARYVVHARRVVEE